MYPEKLYVTWAVILYKLPGGKPQWALYSSEHLNLLFPLKKPEASPDPKGNFETMIFERIEIFSLEPRKLPDSLVARQLSGSQRMHTCQQFEQKNGG